MGLAWEFAVGAEGDTARDGWVGSAMLESIKKLQPGEPSWSQSYLASNPPYA